MTAATASSNGRVAPARVYKLHARPAWRRFLLTREAAIIALLILVIAIASVTVRNFDSPLTVTYLLRDVAPILLIAIALFVLGAGACAAAQSMTQLILARVLQGLGAGGLMPVALVVTGAP